MRQNRQELQCKGQTTRIKCGKLISYSPPYRLLFIFEWEGQLDRMIVAVMSSKANTIKMVMTDQSDAHSSFTHLSRRNGSGAGEGCCFINYPLEVLSPLPITRVKKIIRTTKLL